jgi:hypothetical protein
MRKLWILGALALLAACSDDSGREQGSFSPTGITGVGVTGDLDESTGDFDQTAGGTGPKLDVEAMSAGDEGGGPGSCESLVDEAEVGPKPQDILVVIDNSGSMSEEADFVQQYMNSFSIQIEAANIDSHIVLISGYPDQGAGVCIDPPLGSGGCPGEDNNPPDFVHIGVPINSHDALQQIIANYPSYSQYLRQTAVTHVVVISDDNSDLSAPDFIAQMAGLSPHLSDFVFHGIIAPEDPIQACLNGTTCCTLAAEQGTVYQQLINTTGGVEGNLCEQQFQPIFQAVAQQVIGGATLSCSWEIPEPPPGESFDKDEVNIEFDDGQGGTLQIGRVDDPSLCGGVPDGWYYNDPVSPSVIHACPQTCTKLQGFAQASIAIIFGCATIPAG